MKTKLKLSTLVKIANEIASERGSLPKMTMNELWAELESCAGNCRTKEEAREAILEYVFCVEKSA